MDGNQRVKGALAGAAILLAGFSLCSAAKADEAIVLKYSGGKLVFAGVSENAQFLVGNGFLDVDSKAYGFRDKCTGLIVRLLDDLVVKQSKDPVNCSDLPRPQN